MKAQEADACEILQFITKDETASLTGAGSPKGFRIAGERNLHGSVAGQAICFRPGDAILVGGGAVVLECWGEGDLKARHYALKAPRPSQLRRHQSIWAEIEEQRASREEFVRTARLSHPNVASIIVSEKVDLPATPGARGAGNGPGAPPETDYSRDSYEPRVVFALLEWVEGATPFAAYLRDHCRSFDEFVRLVRECLEGLRHIHEAGLVHWDIKSGNCLVDKFGRVRVSDLGNARDCAKQGSKYSRLETAYTSWENSPEVFRVGRDASLNDNRIKVLLRRGLPTWDRPWLDLYMFGRMLRDILAFPDWQKQLATGDNFHSTVFRGDQGIMARTFLLRFCDRLCLDLPRKLSENAEPTRYYRDCVEALADWAKITGEYGAATGLPELHTVPQHVIKLPGVGHVVYSERTQAAINSRLVKRLRLHHQLGFTRDVFPGATHTRFEHSVGTLGATIDYIRGLYANPYSSDFRILMDSIDVRAVLFAALIHDAGHGAFSHYLEDNTGLFHGLTHEDYIYAVLQGVSKKRVAFPGLGGTESGTSSARTGFSSDCESLAAAARSWLVEGETLDSFLTEVAFVLRPDGPDSPASCPGFANEDLLECQGAQHAKHHILHTIIDGPLDTDKTDYLRRDSLHTGSGYAESADVPRLLQSLTVATTLPVGGRVAPKRAEGHEPPSFTPCIALTTKGKYAVESLLFARYQAFDGAYWHHTTRAEVSVLSYLVWRFLLPQGGGFDKIAYIQNRLQLVTDFRGLTDEQAAEWFMQPTRFDRVCRIGSPAYRARIAALIDSIRFREQLPKQLFVASPADIGPERVKEDLAKLILHNQALDLLAATDPLAYSVQRERVVLDLCTAVRELLPRGVDGSEVINEATLFVDVPLRTKDQVEGLYVVCGEAALPFGLASHADESQRYWPMHTVNLRWYSPIAQFIGGAFRLWLRQVRVFVSGEARTLLTSPRVDPYDVKEVVWSALCKAFERVPLDEDLKRGLKQSSGREILGWGSIAHAPDRKLARRT